MRIDRDFPGGNIEVRSLEGYRAQLAAELRDTEGDWFYWSFRVRGAAGRVVTFDFSPKHWLGYFGPAVSRDQISWQWAGGASADRASFTYAFAEGEDEVYFCHDLPYSVARFERFAAQNGLLPQPLCRSEKGNIVPMLRLGEGPEAILVTSRHHCCESTGTYVMEGILREFLSRPLPGVRLLAVPFMDIDGVLAGDQGKSRAPHDHNRDYSEAPIYESVRAVMALSRHENIVYMFDLHSPWHLGGRNDVAFEVRKNLAMRPAQVRFGELLEAEARAHPASFQYETANDLDANVEWNRDDVMVSSSTGFFTRLPGVRLCFSLETPYFGTAANAVTQENLVEFGRCMARALRAAHGEGVGR